MTPDRIFELILGVVVTLLGADKILAWWSGRRKVDAEAEKAKAEAEKVKAETQKVEAEIDDVAAKSAVDMYIQSNTWLQGRLKDLDCQIVSLKKEAASEKQEREAMARKYDELKRWVSNAFDTLIFELSQGESPTIDRAIVIQTIRRVQATKPKTGPLGTAPSA